MHQTRASTPYQLQLEIDALRAELARVHTDLARVRAELKALRRRNGSLVMTLIALQQE